MNLAPRGIVAYLAGLAQKVTGNAVARAVSSINPVALTTVGAGTLTAALLAPGNIIQRTGPTGAFNETLDTAANMTAAYPEIGIGESYICYYSNLVAQTATFVAGNGFTLGAIGIPTNAGSGLTNMLVITKVSDTAWTCFVSGN